MYLVGLDRVREEIRSYRLSRITSGIEPDDPASAAPEDFVARDHVSAGPWGPAGTESVRMRVAFAPEMAWMGAGQLANARPVATRSDGWVELEAAVPAAADERLVTWILSFADDAEVLAPQELRDAVTTRLEAIVASV
jgi:proteasome accessory factor B